VLSNRCRFTSLLIISPPVGGPSSERARPRQRHPPRPHRDARRPASLPAGSRHGIVAAIRGVRRARSTPRGELFAGEQLAASHLSSTARRSPWLVPLWSPWAVARNTPTPPPTTSPTPPPLTPTALGETWEASRRPTRCRRRTPGQTSERSFPSNQRIENRSPPTLGGMVAWLLSTSNRENHLSKHRTPQWGTATMVYAFQL